MFCLAVSCTKIAEIAGHIRQAQRVSFITGAGTSLKAGIPPADGLVQIISRDYPHCLTTLTPVERTSYGPAVPGRPRKADPTTAGRGAAELGPGGTGGMMQNGTVQRVLTFNFDLVLERAAALIGLDVAAMISGSPQRTRSPASQSRRSSTCTAKALAWSC